MTDRRQQQESLYRFPYHYLPQLDESGGFSRFMALSWGFGYLCCLLNAAEEILAAAPASILDVGCGDGRLLSLLAGRTDAALTGIDNSEKAIALARALNPGRNFIAGGLDGFNEKSACVSCLDVLEHIADGETAGFIDRICDLVQPGGRLIVGVPSVNRPFSSKHYRHYSESTLLAQLAAETRGLTVEKVRHVFNGSDRLFRLYSRLTCNRWWFIGCGSVETLVWRYVWQRLRQAEPATGHQILVTLRRPA